MRVVILAAFVATVLPACRADHSAPPADAAARPAPSTTVAMPDAPATNATVAAAAPQPMPSTAGASFADKTWRVEPGGDVEAGSTYTFRRDGTLRMTAPHGTPSTGQWRYEGGRLTMVEDGVAYPTDIVSQDATHLVLRSHNPGGSVEIALVADAPARP